MLEHLGEAVNVPRMDRIDHVEARPREVARVRQELDPLRDRELDLEEDAEPEDRHGEPDEGERHDGPVDGAPGSHSRDDSEEHARERGDEHGAARELDRRGKALPELVPDRPPGVHPALAEVAARDPAHVGHVLDDDRPVVTVLRVDRGDLGLRELLAAHGAGRARDQLRRRHDEEGDSEEDGDGGEEPAKDELDHFSSETPRKSRRPVGCSFMPFTSLRHAASWSAWTSGIMGRSSRTRFCAST